MIYFIEMLYFVFWNVFFLLLKLSCFSLIWHHMNVSKPSHSFRSISQFDQNFSSVSYVNLLFRISCYEAYDNLLIWNFCIYLFLCKSICNINHCHWQFFVLTHTVRPDNHLLIDHVKRNKKKTAQTNQDQSIVGSCLVCAFISLFSTSNWD